MVISTNVGYLGSLIGSYFLRKQKYIVGKIQLVIYYQCCVLIG